ncbi:MAG: hypothetical protein COB78_09870 [Hyphomicrobiales bacterium]|nr:MAG: hypothetical protein COB78_09870 [Hyphomicrobiales bacterium]
MSDVNCPYCGYGNQINHDDGFGYREDEKHQQECSDCEKTFVFTTSISYHYEPEKAICLNGGDHEFEPTFTFPIEHTKMECELCWERRVPTDQEMVGILEVRSREFQKAQKSLPPTQEKEHG